MKSAAVLENLERYLHSVSTNRQLATLLAYRAVSRWWEIDVSSLETFFADTTFNYVSKSREAPLPDGDYDCILVPLYGFTSDRYRLGHGSGWYDRLLEIHPTALKVGVGLEIGHIDFDNEPHDVALDYVITEARF